MSKIIDLPKEIKAVWLCDCGIETEQPQGPQERLITHCKCGKELWRLKEADGIVTEYHPAPDWFVTEFEESLKNTGMMEQQFLNASHQYVALLAQMKEMQGKIQADNKRRSEMIQSGLNRTKLAKRQDMKWMYNIPLKKFMGRKKEEVNGV